MARIKKIIAEYNGFHTDYIFTTYYPNGLIDEEEGIEAIQVLTDKGGWTINFTQNGDEYNFTNVLEILQKSDFSAIAGMEPEMEVGDSSGVDGQLFLNGEIHQSDEEHLIIKGASEIIDNDWDKIGERDTYEVVVSGGEPQYVEIIFEDESKKNFDNINDAVAFIKNNLPAPESNREVVMEALKQDGMALNSASDDLKKDKEVVMVAVNRSGYALEYASETLKADKEVVMAALQENGSALKFASETLKADKEVVMAAVQSGSALKFASETLKADKEVVMAAVNRSGYALEYASETLKADKEVVMTAVNRSGSALEFASETLKADKEVVMAAVQEKGSVGYALEYASETLKADKEVVMAAVQQNSSYAGKKAVLKYASDDLKADPEILRNIK